MKKVCIYHIAEQFLYEYYEQPGEYVLSEKDEVSPLLEKAAEEEKRGGIVAAAQYYEQAEEWNPAGTAVRFHLIDCYFRLNRREDVLAETRAVYPYCCTRAEMAQYYRWLGWYHLESYHPELAEVLYRYSTFFEESRQAESEIRFLESALNAKMPSYSVEELQARLTKAEIPLAASNVTMALLVRAEEEAEQNYRRTGAEAWRNQALDCCHMVLDCTGDEEMKERIRRLS